MSDPIQLAINRSPAGATGPIGIILFLVWVLAVTALMLVKRAWHAKPQHAVLATEAPPPS